MWIQANDPVNVSIAALSFIEEGAVMDFDTHDKRYNWRNDSNGAREDSGDAIRCRPLTDPRTP